MVMVSLALLMAIITEMSTKETVRYKLAINERDALAAEALAQSGANFSQLILTVQEPLQTYMANFAKMGIELPAYTIWQLMPIDSDLLKGITDGSFLPTLDILKNDEDTKPSEPQASVVETEKTPLFGKYVAPEGGYGGFRGRFSVEIEDEERKISIRGWPKKNSPEQKIIADQIFRILSKPENSILFDGSTGDNRNIRPGQLVGNIYDYISDGERAVDITAPAERWGRDTVGDKRALYNDPTNVQPKRAPMDSIAELRLVPGMTDAIFSVLSKVITIYGESDKINVLSAPDEVLASIFFVCAKNKDAGPFQQLGFDAKLLEEWNRKKSLGELNISSEGIISFLEENNVEVDKDQCLKNTGAESKTFSVRSTATVGTVTKTLLVRLRSAAGMTTLYQFQYL